MEIRGLPVLPPGHAGGIEVRSSATREASTPPEGMTGSSLWELLTPEERAFFTEAAAAGPLTYGRATRAPALPPGLRLDVRG